MYSKGTHTRTYDIQSHLYRYNIKKHFSYHPDTSVDKYIDFCIYICIYISLHNIDDSESAKQVSSLYRCTGQLGDVHFAADGTAEVGSLRGSAADGAEHIGKSLQNPVFFHEISWFFMA